MADVTVKQLAQVVGIPVERLLNQLQEAGLSIVDDQQTVNEDQKRILLNHLKGGTSPDKQSDAGRITLRRKSVSQVTLGHDSHSGKTVNIEVRQKKTYIKRASLTEQPAEIEDDVALIDIQETVVVDGQTDLPESQELIVSVVDETIVADVSLLNDADLVMSDTLHPVVAAGAPDVTVPAAEVKSDKSAKKKPVSKKKAVAKKRKKS